MRCRDAVLTLPNAGAALEAYHFDAAACRQAPFVAKRRRAAPFAFECRRQRSAAVLLPSTTFSAAVCAADAARFEMPPVGRHNVAMRQIIHVCRRRRHVCLTIILR